MNFIIINTILVIITLSIIGVLLTHLYKIWQVLKPQQVIQELHEKYSVKEDSVYGMVLQKIICKLKHDLNASRVIIARFHNGGNYVNGLPMKKFTVTHETASKGSFLMDKCFGIINSRYSQAFAQLATLEEYCIADRDDCPDLNYAKDMKFYEFNASYLFLLKQFDGKEEGFIGINFAQTRVLSKEERDIVKYQLDRIMGLLNMDKKHL
jgi:hypothetical protein